MKYFFIRNNKLINNTKEALTPSSQRKLHKTTYRTKPKMISRLAMSCIGSLHSALSRSGHWVLSEIPLLLLWDGHSHLGSFSCQHSLIIPAGTTLGPKVHLNLQPLVGEVWVEPKLRSTTTLTWMFPSAEDAPSFAFSNRNTYYWWHIKDKSKRLR